MFDNLDPWALQAAEWLQARVGAHETKFPAHVAQMKAAVIAARQARDAATTDEEIALAVERESEAIYALITALPRH